MVNLKHKSTINKSSIKGSDINLEDFLKNNGFELETYYSTNKRYRKEITEHQTLYVRIYSDVNKIQNVEYESRAPNEFEKEGIICFDTIDTLSKLKLVIKAL